MAALIAFAPFGIKKFLSGEELNDAPIRFTSVDGNQFQIRAGFIHATVLFPTRAKDGALANVYWQSDPGAIDEVRVRDTPKEIKAAYGVAKLNFAGLTRPKFFHSICEAARNSRFGRQRHSQPTLKKD